MLVFHVVIKKIVGYWFSLSMSRPAPDNARQVEKAEVGGVVVAEV